MKLHILEYNGDVLRCVVDQGQPWLAVPDVCRILKAPPDAALKPVASKCRRSQYLEHVGETLCVNTEGVFDLALPPASRPQSFLKWLVTAGLPGMDQPASTPPALAPATITAPYQSDTDVMDELIPIVHAEHPDEPQRPDVWWRLGREHGFFGTSYWTSASKSLHSKLGWMLAKHGGHTVSTPEGILVMTQCGEGKERRYGVLLCQSGYQPTREDFSNYLAAVSRLTGEALAKLTNHNTRL